MNKMIQNHTFCALLNIVYATTIVDQIKSKWSNHLSILVSIFILCCLFSVRSAWGWNRMKTCHVWWPMTRRQDRNRLAEDLLLPLFHLYNNYIIIIVLCPSELVYV